MTTDHDAGADWITMFDAHSTRDEVTAAAERWTRYTLDVFHADLTADPDFTPRERAALVARAARQVRAHTRDVFFRVWLRLQDEARLLETDAGTVH